MIIHPLHAWKLNLYYSKNSSHLIQSQNARDHFQASDNVSVAYIRGEHRVARWGLFHRDRQTEGACFQSAVLHQRDPLQVERKARDLLKMAQQQKNVGVWEYKM